MTAVFQLIDNKKLKENIVIIDRESKENYNRIEGIVAKGVTNGSFTITELIDQIPFDTVWK